MRATSFHTPAAASHFSTVGSTSRPVWNSRFRVSVSVSCNASVQRECAQLCARHLRAKHFGKLLEEECGLGLLEEDCGLGLLERLWFRAWEEDCRALGAHTKLAASVCVCAYGMHAVCACTWKRESSKTSNHADCQRSAVTSLLARRRRPPRRRRRLRRRDVTL